MEMVSASQGQANSCEWAGIRAKAEDFGSSLNKNNFKPSTGWLDGFIERNNISFKNVCGVYAGIDEQAAGEQKDELVKIIKEAPAKNVFNAKENELFLKCTPDKTMTFKGKYCSSGKLSKECITRMVGG